MTSVTVQEQNSTIAIENGPTVTVKNDSVSVITAAEQGPPGVSAASYTHTQASASSTWTVNHNLGFRPSVEILSAGGVEIEGTVTHTSVNQAILSFTSSITGSARFN